MLKPLQANLDVDISKFEARILPFGGGERGPVASMGGDWSNNHRCQIPIVSANAFDRSHRCSLDSRAFVVSYVVLIY
jgi:hypothetical protein